jgi:hypothetical protein
MTKIDACTSISYQIKLGDVNAVRALFQVMHFANRNWLEKIVNYRYYEILHSIRNHLYNYNYLVLMSIAKQLYFHHSICNGSNVYWRIKIFSKYWNCTCRS